MITSKTHLLFALALASMPSLADTVRVENVWVRPTAPGQKVAGAYMDLTADADMTLLSAASPVAREVELHRMAMENGVMMMQPLPRIALPKGKTVSLRPGAMHVMLIGLNGQIRAGDRTPITLTVRGTEGKELKVTVEALARQDAGKASAKHDYRH